MSHLNLSADIVDMVKLSLQSLFQIFQLSFKNQTNEKNPTSIAWTVIFKIIHLNE